MSVIYSADMYFDMEIKNLILVNPNQLPNSSKSPCIAISNHKMQILPYIDKKYEWFDVPAWKSEKFGYFIQICYGWKVMDQIGHQINVQHIRIQDNIIVGIFGQRLFLNFV